MAYCCALSFSFASLELDVGHRRRGNHRLRDPTAWTARPRRLPQMAASAESLRVFGRGRGSPISGTFAPGLRYGHRGQDRPRR